MVEVSPLDANVKPDLSSSQRPSSVGSFPVKPFPRPLKTWFSESLPSSGDGVEDTVRASFMGFDIGELEALELLRFPLTSREGARERVKFHIY